MSLKLYNTLSGKKEEFTPLNPKEVTMYNCGPTVYNFAHIGNLRAYVFVDMLLRTLEYNGYKVKQVMNITDVGHLTSDSDDGDDKMIKALKREGKPFTLEAMREIADIYTKAFKEDLVALNCKIPDEMPRASDHIIEDIEIIKKLEEKGIAYKTSDGIYFDIKKFPNYGKLGNINLEGQQAGIRVAVNSEKKNPSDFSLWKTSSNDIGWESPWGKGFPGWHIECSAMSRKYLGQPFDIHTGGVDHIPVHHNNEIAQSEAAYDVPLANYWLHNEYLIVPSGKMAKSGENFITLETLRERKIHPLSYRYFLLQAHYRSPINFSWDALEAAQTGLGRIYKELASMQGNGEIRGAWGNNFKNSIGNDLNTSEGLGLVHEILGDNIMTMSDKLTTLLDYDRVLGLGFAEARLAAQNLTAASIPETVVKLAALRENARKEEDWKEADELRDEIKKLGFEIKDTDSGQKIEKM